MNFFSSHYKLMRGLCLQKYPVNSIEFSILLSMEGKERRDWTILEHAVQDWKSPNELLLSEQDCVGIRKGQKKKGRKQKKKAGEITYKSAKAIPKKKRREIIFDKST